MSAAIQGIYIALFGRPADPGGLAYWTEVMKGGADLSAMLSVLPNLTEYTTRFEGQTPDQVITTVYQNLFGRAPDAEGLAFFKGQLASGAQTLATIAVNIMQGAQGDDKADVTAKVSAAELFTASLDTPEEIAAYKGADAAALAKKFLDTVDKDKPATPEIVEKAAGAVVVGQDPTGGQAPNPGGGGGGNNNPDPVDPEPQPTLTYEYNATVALTSTNKGEGKELIVGDGIYVDGKVKVLDSQYGYELAMGASYRQGKQLTGDKVSDGVIRITADAGSQTAETGDGLVNANRSAVSFDYSWNTGDKKAGSEGLKLQLLIDIDGAVGVTDFVTVTFEEVSTNLWIGFTEKTTINPDGSTSTVKTPVINDEVPNFNVIQESSNFGFGFISDLLKGRGTNPGDIAAGEYEVYTQVVSGTGAVVSKVGIIFDLVGPSAPVVIEQAVPEIA